jgi:hypothetical protein
MTGPNVKEPDDRFAGESILLIWAELLELFEIADRVLNIKIPGRPFHCPGSISSSSSSSGSGQVRPIAKLQIGRR